LTIGEHDRHVQSVSHPNGDQPSLSVVAAHVFRHEMGTAEDQSRERKIESAISLVGIALGRIPSKRQF
jgi:hypothetical protein